jgi:hypothetical protein
MALRKIFFIICLIISTVCLTVGYVITGLWIGAVIALITGLAWLPSRKYPSSWLPHLYLFAFVCLAVVGRLTGSPPLLMICGSVAALAVWDLLFLDDTLKGISYGGQTRRFENSHLQSLALVLGCGLIVAFVGRLLNFQIPFVVLLLFVVLVVFGLDRVWGYIKKRSVHIS